MPIARQFSIPLLPPHSWHLAHLLFQAQQTARTRLTGPGSPKDTRTGSLCRRDEAFIVLFLCFLGSILGVITFRSKLLDSLLHHREGSRVAISFCIISLCLRLSREWQRGKCTHTTSDFPRLRDLAFRLYSIRFALS